MSPPFTNNWPVLMLCVMLTCEISAEVSAITSVALIFTLSVSTLGPILTVHCAAMVTEKIAPTLMFAIPPRFQFCIKPIRRLFTRPSVKLFRSPNTSDSAVPSTVDVEPPWIMLVLSVDVCVVSPWTVEYVPPSTSELVSLRTCSRNTRSPRCCCLAKPRCSCCPGSQALFLPSVNELMSQSSAFMSTDSPPGNEGLWRRCQSDFGPCSYKDCSGQPH